MANMNLKVTIAATNTPQQISKSFPARTGGLGNLAETMQPAPFADAGAIFCQQIIFQNQGSHQMEIGDASTTASSGLQLTATGGSANISTAINYGTYLSDWWVVGTAGDVLFIIYIQ